MEPFKKIKLSCCVYVCVGGWGGGVWWSLGYLSLPLGVTTLHITPVILQFFKEYLSCNWLGCLFLLLGVTTLHITPVSILYMVTMLLDWWWLASTAWHAHS